MEAIKKLLADCSLEEQKTLRHYLSSLAPHPLEREWGIDAETILSAIRRSSDLTRRGVRGIIAEAVFESVVLPPLLSSGWEANAIIGDTSYDVLLENAASSARIQIKLQRMEKGVPKLYRPKNYERGSLYVVEVQKTRSGKRTIKPISDGAQIAEEVTIQTRPYRFGDFDVLAVNMHPAFGDWKSFRYTVASWLLARVKDRTQIEVLQPVAAEPNDVWTDDLGTCLGWLKAGDQRTVLTDRAK